MSDKPPLSPLDRRDLLEQFYGAKTQTELAVKAGVSRKTIERDVAKWKRSGRYDEWLDERWHSLLDDEDVPKTLKFISLTRIKLRRMIEKHEVKGDVTIRMFGLGDKKPVRVTNRGAEVSTLQSAETVPR